MRRLENRKMKRVEIFISQAIETDFLQMYERECRRTGIKCKYTKLDGVKGAGNTDPRLGDAIWPKLNVMFILFVEADFVSRIEQILKILHKNFVGEGAVAFVSDALELRDE